MNLIEERNTAIQSIKSFKDGKIIINDKSYNEAVLISTKDIYSINNQTKNLNTILNDKKTIELINNYKENDLIDILIIGSNEKVEDLDSKIIHDLYKKNIGIEIMPQLAACKTFNVLASEHRKVIALIKP